MAYAITLVFEGVSEQQYWAVNEKLDIDRNGEGDYPAGMLVHAAGPTPTGWVVSEVWESRAAQETFMATRLGEALAANDVPPPVQVIDTDTVNVRQT